MILIAQMYKIKFQDFYTFVNFLMWKKIVF